MWWLNDDWDEQPQRIPDRILHGRSLTDRLHSSPRTKRVSLLTEAESQANKLLQEVGTYDDSFVRQIQQLRAEREKQAKEHAANVGKLTAELDAAAKRYQESLKQLQDQSKCRIGELRQEIEQLNGTLGDQVRDRERYQLQSDRLRKLLLEAEEKIAERGQQLTELRNELDQQRSASEFEIAEREQRHQHESAYLRSTANDAETRAEKAEREVQKLREFSLRLTASHHAQLNETRRRCEVDLRLVRQKQQQAELSNEQIAEQLTEQTDRLNTSETKRQELSNQIASLLQQQQIAASDAETRVEKAEAEVKKLREFSVRLTASHHAQLTETRRRCEVDLRLVQQKQQQAEQSSQQMAEQLAEQNERLNVSETKRQALSNQIASLLQQQQIADSVVRQTQDEANARAAQDQAEIDSLRAATKQLEMANARLKGEAQEAQNEFALRRAELERRVQLAEQHVRHVDDAIAAGKRQINHLTEQVQQSTATIRKLRAKLEQVETEASTIQSRCEHITAAWQVSQVELSRLKQQFSEHLDHAAHNQRVAKANIATLTREKDQLRQQLSRQSDAGESDRKDRQQQAIQLQKQLEQKTADFAAACHEIDSQSAEIDRLVGSLEKMKLENERLIELQQSEFPKWQASVNELTAQLDEEKQLRERAESEVRRLAVERSERITQLASEREQLQMDLNRARAGQSIAKQRYRQALAHFAREREQVGETNLGEIEKLQRKVMALRNQMQREASQRRKAQSALKRSVESNGSDPIAAQLLSEIESQDETLRLCNTARSRSRRAA